ncbi:MAG: hypothetical protein LBB67_03160 [Oscillospiraceae bacterium]|jgi:hypothetical protein|nr:hypothetical protein [Oscillospiraceae bacterium]
MVSVIIGKRGAGKTKRLIALVNTAAEQSSGHVICIEKEQKLTYDISSTARLVSADSYNVQGYDALYGFICGICAGDHDITDVFVDATLRIAGRDYGQLDAFLKKLVANKELGDTDIMFTISAESDELPVSVLELCKE